MKKIFINSLTVSRILFGLLFLYIVLFDFNIYYLSFIFIMTAFSDFFDGKLSEHYCLESEFGAKLDVFCDFTFIFLATLSLVFIDLIPFWYLFIIILKLIEFFFTSSNQKGFYYDRFGHFVALMFYALPMLVVLLNSKTISIILCIIITICGLISSIMRINHFANS